MCLYYQLIDFPLCTFAILQKPMEVSEIAISLLKTRTSVWQRNDMDQAQQMRFSVCVSVSVFRLLTKEKKFHSSARSIVFHVKDSPLPAWRQQGGTEWISRSRSMYWRVH
jgi:hypothetical protein